MPGRPPPCQAGSMQCAPVGCNSILWGTVAGVCTQTPEFVSLRLAFRGLSTDPGHDRGAHCGPPQRIWLHPAGTDP